MPMQRLVSLDDGSKDGSEPLLCKTPSYLGTPVLSKNEMPRERRTTMSHRRGRASIPFELRGAEVKEPIALSKERQRDAREPSYAMVPTRS